MKDPGQPLLDIAPQVRDAVVRKWLAQVLEDYPEETSRFLLQTRDPFRNPVGRALREGLPVLLDEITGGMDSSRIDKALDEIVHIRAIQDFTASQAVGFLFSLKPTIREELTPILPVLETLFSRIDETVLRAFDLYMACREKTYEIKANEAKRRVYLLERAAGAQ